MTSESAVSALLSDLAILESTFPAEGQQTITRYSEAQFKTLKY